MEQVPYDVPAYQLMEDVLRELAPDELPYLPQVWTAFLRDPREAPGGEELLGHGEVAAELTLLATILGPIVRDLLIALAAEGIRDAGQRAHRSWRQRRKRTKQAKALLTSAEPLPALDDTSAGEASELIRTAAVDGGRSPEQAKQIVHVLLSAYRRRAAGPPPAGPSEVPTGPPPQ